MKSVDKKPGSAKSRAGRSARQPPPVSPPVACRRCGAPGPVGEDGFCEKCEKALEQACL